MLYKTCPQIELKNGLDVKQITLECGGQWEKEPNHVFQGFIPGHTILPSVMRQDGREKKQGFDTIQNQVPGSAGVRPPIFRSRVRHLLFAWPQQLP